MSDQTFEQRVSECMAHTAALHQTVFKIDPAILDTVIKLADTNLGQVLFDEFARHEEALRFAPAAPGERAKAMVKILKLTAFYIDELRKIETP